MDQGEGNLIDDGAKPAVYRELPVNLTGSELQEAGEQLAANIGALERIEQARKEDNDFHNAKAKAVKPVIERLARIVRERQELREIEIRELVVLGTKTVRTIRVDTGEELSTRPMTDAENQRSLFAPVPDAADAGGEDMGSNRPPPPPPEG